MSASSFRGRFPLLLASLLGVAALGVGSRPALGVQGEEPPSRPALGFRADEQSSGAALPTPLTLNAALAWALINNPELAVIRQQRGIAAADVVIAHTYPFNPILENRAQVASGPESAGVTNNLPLEHLLLWELEIRGQGKWRRVGANAALTRTEWDIANQEHLLGVRVVRTFQTVLYQHQKLRLIEETIRLNEQLVRNATRLQKEGNLKTADLLVAQTELDITSALLGAGRSALLKSQFDLRSALGLVGDPFELRGELETTTPSASAQDWIDRALDRRADFRARTAAAAEANAKVGLAYSDRLGNPTLGPAFTYDNSRVVEAGVQLNLPLPVANRHRGEILKAEAELGRANLEVRQTEILIRQDVLAALARLDAARERVASYRMRVLPNLQRSLDNINQLFKSGEAGVDFLRVIDVQRKLLAAKDGYLDSLSELNQAQADLLAAVGDPVLALEFQQVRPGPR